MLTETETEIELPPELASITETVYYPPEVVDRWLKESEITMQKFRNGEIQCVSLEELALKYGFKLGD